MPSPPPRKTPPPQSQQQQQQVVSLRGASSKEISRDALLQKVSLERELRSYNRRAAAAALSIQRVWRRYHVMKKVAEQLQEEWEVSVNHNNAIMRNIWISKNLLRPFLLFASHSLRLHQKLHFTNVKRMSLCFRILLQSINSAEPQENFCSLAIGTSEEKATWLYQAKKLISLCSFILAECDPNCREDQDLISFTVLGMRLIVSLTDPLGWKSFNSENIGDARVAVKDLITFMITKNCGLYSSIRRYITKSNVDIASTKKINAQTDKHFLITASAITLALRPLCVEKLGINHISIFDIEHAAEQFCTYVLTIPCLIQRLPPVLLPAVRHESSLLLCLKVQLVVVDFQGENLF